MKLRNLLFALVAAMFVACSTSPQFTSFVDPKIGTGDHGHVFVGANVPFGMVQVGPTSIPQSWDIPSSYSSSNNLPCRNLSAYHLSYDLPLIHQSKIFSHIRLSSAELGKVSFPYSSIILSPSS